LSSSSSTNCWRREGLGRNRRAVAIRAGSLGEDIQIAPQRRILCSGAVAGLCSQVSTPAAADGPSGLQQRLASKSAEQLRSPIFNIPPRQQIFPQWLEGTWQARQVFAGFVFPLLPRERVMREVDVPGFKTCSIIDIADVGKSPVEFDLRWVSRQGIVLEDVPFNLKESVRGHLDKGEVTRVDYEPEKDPNRLTLAIRGSRNAERVELFVNSRDSEAPKDNPDLFFTSEYRRQVTFSSRVVQGYSGNYQHFRTFRRSGTDSVRVNVLTACYVDPLNPLYFEAIDKPVVVFSHQMNLTRRSPAEI